MMQSWQIPRLTLCAMMVLFAASAYGLNMCTEDKVNSCMKMMSRLDNGTDLITKLTEECRNVRKFEICIEPMKSTCKPALKLLIEMIEGSYKFSCQKRNFYEFRKYADCVDEVMPEIVNRTSEFTYDMERDARRNTLICKFMKDYLRDVVNIVRPTCGFAAARYMRSWYLQVLKPHINRAECSFSFFWSFTAVIY